MNNNAVLLAGLFLAFTAPVYAQNTNDSGAQSPEPQHGATFAPEANQFKCINDGHAESPPEEAGTPNTARKNAYLYTPDPEPWQRNPIFNDWPAYSQNLSGAEPADKMPDGLLCAAGHPQNFTCIAQPHSKCCASTFESYRYPGINEHRAKIQADRVNSLQTDVQWVRDEKPARNLLQLQ